jgi:transposase
VAFLATAAIQDEYAFAKERPSMDASTRFDTQIVGALPVITNYCERLNMADTIDALVPWEGEVPLGTLVEVMVANRLLQPRAMFRIGEWAQQAALTDYYDLTAAQLNDDRLGRALERLAEHRESIQAALTLQAIKVFGLKVDQIHCDITDVELFGAYEQDLPEGEPPPTPQPAYGRTKSGRRNVKQIQCGLSVTNDGGVPIALQPLDGNTAESTTHLDNLRQLRQMLPQQDFIYTADTKLDSQENLLAIHAGDGKFLCGGAFQPHHQEAYLKIRKKLKRIDYCPQSQAKLPRAERDQYKAYETTESIEGVVDARVVRLTYRLIYVWSEAKARQEAQTRERHMEKIEGEFEQVQTNLNKYSLKTRDKIVRRLEQAKGRYSEGKLLTYTLTERAGKFSLSWKIDARALARQKQLEGVYLLKTNLTKRQCPTADALSEYKQQSQVERRFGHLKGPLAVAPMFLKNPRRMAGLLCVLVWALMVLALMERQVRKSLKGKPLYGLYPENRPSPAPTGPSLLQCFSTLCIVIVKHKGTTTRRLAQPTATQNKLLLLLGIPPDTLRTFKRRCGM